MREKKHWKSFNLIRFIGNSIKKFNLPRDYIKFVSKVEWIVELSLNYCLIKILENLNNYCCLQVGTEWNIEKAVWKNSNKILVFLIDFIINRYFLDRVCGYNYIATIVSIISINIGFFHLSLAKLKQNEWKLISGSERTI